MCLSGDYVSKREKQLIKLLRNYEVLVESEQEVQQLLQERMKKWGSDGKDHLEESFWRIAWKSFHRRVLYDRSKTAT